MSSTATCNRLQNAIRTVKGLQLEVDDIVFNGLASSLALLTNEQKELGSLVIDIGGGTTDYVVYANGIIKHTGVLAVGGDHVSNDLAYGLKVPLSRAEQLKIDHGSGLPRGGSSKAKPSPLSNELGLPLKTVNLEHLRRIMSLRLEEIFQLIAQDLEQAGALDYLRGGRVPLRRRRAHPANRQAGRAGPANARLPRQDQFHQRPEIRPGPAGVCRPPSGW